MDIVPQKICSRCREHKPETPEFFNRDNRAICGLTSDCRDCRKKLHTDFNRSMGHKPNNFAVIGDSKRRCTKCYIWYPDTFEFFYADKQKRSGKNPICKVCNNKQKQHWRDENPEKVIEASRLQFIRNPEKSRANARNYIKRNPIKIKVRYQQRQARKRSLPNTLTAEQWATCLSHFGHSCAVCGRSRGLWHTLAMDHWIPLSSPQCIGTTVKNVVPLCHGADGCNNSKGSRDAAEWLTSKYGKRKAGKILKHIQSYFDSLWVG